MLIDRQYSGIPVVGASGALSSYAGARTFQQHAKEIIQEGVEKYPGSVFRVPTMDGWMVVVSGHQLVDELRAAREDELSFREAVEAFVLGQGAVFGLTSRTCRCRFGMRQLESPTHHPGQPSARTPEFGMLVLR